MATRQFRFAACVLGAMLMLNPAGSSNAWAHGGGGGGHGGGGFGGGGFGGGHGGFGGGHGGWGGGGWGGGHSGWGGGGWGGGGGAYIGGHTGGYYGGHSAYYGGTNVGRGITGGMTGMGRSLGNPGFASRHFAGMGTTGLTSAGRLATGSHNMHSNFNHFNHHNNIFFGYGYPFFLFGFPFGYGYLGYGYGYGGYGYGNYGYGNYGYGYPAAYTVNVQPTAEQLASATDFTNQGEEAFMAGRYQEAVQKWQHALVDNPNNGGLMLLLSQALFAVGQFDPAAGALQLSMRMLPQNQWNTVVANYKELYPDIQKYTDQLRALEKARTDAPKNPALRFLLGYHYGYLGYPKNAVEELDQAIEIQPKDELAVDLRNIFARQAGLPEVPATQEKPATNPATQAAPPAEKKTS